MWNVMHSPRKCVPRVRQLSSTLTLERERRIVADQVLARGMYVGLYFLTSRYLACWFIKVESNIIIGVIQLAISAAEDTHVSGLFVFYNGVEEKSYVHVKYNRYLLQFFHLL